MSKLEDAKKIIARMNLTEKTQLLQLILRDYGNFSLGIDINSKINGGEPCILRTRIPVWLIVRAHQLGTSDAEPLSNYPTLRAEDLTNAWAYYLYHQEEIESQITENKAA